MFENQRIKFKYLLMSFYVIKQNRRLYQYSKYCINSEKGNLQVVQ